MEANTVIKKGKKEVRAGYHKNKVLLILKEGRKEITIELEPEEAIIISEKLEKLAFKKSYDAWESTKKVIKYLERKKETLNYLTEEQRRHLLDPEIWYDFEMSH